MFDRLAARLTITNETLRRLNLTVAVILLVQAGAVLVAGKGTSLPINVSFLSVDTLQTQITHATVTAPAIHQVTEINIAWLVAVLLCIAAAYHVAIATVWRERYETALKKGTHLFRWPVLAIVGGIMLGGVSLIWGISDLSTLLLIVGAAGALIFGYGVWTGRASGQKRSCSEYIPAIVLGVSLVLMLGITTLSRQIFGATTPLIDLCILLTVLIGGGAICVTACMERTRKGQWTSYAFSELCYSVLGCLLLTAVAWEIFAALLRP